MTLEVRGQDLKLAVENLGMELSYGVGLGMAMSLNLAVVNFVLVLVTAECTAAQN